MNKLISPPIGKEYFKKLTPPDCIFVVLSTNTCAWIPKNFNPKLVINIPKETK